jgi:gas vesicle protein
MNTPVKIALTAIASFAGGYIFGLLTTPQSGKENRDWIGHNADEARKWVGDKGHNFVEESEKRITEIAGNLRQSVKDSIPDLYEATEDIKLNDKELKNG